MGRRAVSVDILVDAAKEGFQRALSDFHYPPIVEPEIIFDKKEEDGFFIDPENWKVHLNVNAAPSHLQKREELVHFFRLISRHEIGHYMIAPYNTVTSLKMIIEAERVLTDRRIAILVANLVADIVDDVTRSEIFECDPILLDGWILTDLHTKGRIPKPDVDDPSFVFFAILVGVKQILWAKRLDFSKCKGVKKILDSLLPRTPFLRGEIDLFNRIDFFHALKIRVPSELENDIKKISKILERGGLSNIGLLPRKTRKVAEIISKYLPKITNDMLRMLERLLSRLLKGDPERVIVDPRDMSDPDGIVRIIEEVSEDSDNPADAVEAKRLLEDAEKRNAGRGGRKSRGSPGGKSAGRGGAKRKLTKCDALRYWYRTVSRKLIRFIVEHKKPSGALPMYPVKWRIDDPIEELDTHLSLSMAPILIPGLTTMKWVREMYYGTEQGKEFPDLLIVIDSSGSMGGIPSDIKYSAKTPYHLALIGSFAALQTAWRRGAYISAINFSDRPIVCDWTRDLRKAEDILLKYQGGGTTFPAKTFDKSIKAHSKKRPKTPILVLIVTDSEIYNWKQTESAILRVLGAGGLVALFFINVHNISKGKFKRILSNGARVYEIRKPEDFIGMVVKIVKETYKA